MFGDVNISAILDSFSVSYDKRVRPNYGGECDRFVVIIQLHDNNKIIYLMFIYNYLITNIRVNVIYNLLLNLLIRSIGITSKTVIFKVFNDRRLLQLERSKIHSGNLNILCIHCKYISNVFVLERFFQNYNFRILTFILQYLHFQTECLTPRELQSVRKCQISCATDEGFFFFFEYP